MPDPRPHRVALRGRWLLTALLATGALPACRACSPAPAATSNATAPAEPAEPAVATDAGGPAPLPTPAELDAAPADDAAVAAADADDGAAAAAALAAEYNRVEQALTQGTTPLAQIIATTPNEVRESVRRAAVQYLRCRGAAEPSACARLAGAERDGCVLDGSQVAARARDAHGWVMTAPLLQMCRGERVPEAECRRYGEAVESGDPSRCAGLPPLAADCPALASGDPAACARIPGADRSCPAQARTFGLLREGVAALAERGEPDRRATAVGVLLGAGGCTQLFRNALPARAP